MTPLRDEPDAGAGEPPVAVTVTRTGGIAGIRREWTARPPHDDVPRWIALIEGCPWEAVGGFTGPGGDRFMWRIRARCGPDERDARLADDQVEGPWRDLVDEVRQSAPAQVTRPDGSSGSVRPGPTSP